MKIYKEDLDWAASQGLITHPQADTLWQALSSRVTDERPQFNFANVAFYFGALIIISAMTWFMSLAWESFGGGGIFLLAIAKRCCEAQIAYGFCFTLAGSSLYFRQNLKVPGGLLFE